MSSPSSSGFRQSSPVHRYGSDKKWSSNQSYDVSGDENDEEDEEANHTAHRDDETPDPSERFHHSTSGRRGREGGGRGRGGRDSSHAGNGLFKDPSAIGKIRHLKKEDGEPLWRYDIQYDFLRAVFDDDRRVFTNSYQPENMGKQCFADLYIDTMARSSKTSKILHDKLLSDRKAAKSMAMVCLLVNIGRMNTTLNFFPEMRAQLRTYHAIPSLQVHQDTHAYKQLQDAPRLKSILKGGCEDRPEPRTLDKLKERDVPRTNPVNLIFLICHSAAKVAELHFPPGREFHDLIMRTNLSSKSRAAAFLWIMWFYLESDFTEEGCDENPFGPGVDYGVDVANQGVPVLQILTPEEEERENRDTPEEREFGFEKKNLRSAILRDEHTFTDITPVKRSSRNSGRPSAGAGGGGGGGGAGASSASGAKEPKEVKESKESSAAPDAERMPGPPAILPRIRPSKHDSDVDSTRSTPPPRSLHRALGAAATNTGSRRANPLKYQIVDGSSPVRQPPLIQQLQQQHQQLQQQQNLQQQMRKRGGKSANQKTANAAVSRMLQDMEDDDVDDGLGTPAPTGGRKPRPPTAHQIAVENNRKQRIEYLLSRGMQRKHHRSRKQRKTDGAIIRTYRRLQEVEDPFEDSENEDSIAWNRALFPPHPGSAQARQTGTAFRERGFAGLVQLQTESEDFGEEISSYAAAIRRTCRRINRWEEETAKGHMAVVPTIKRHRVHDPSDDDNHDPNETEDEMDMDGDFLDMSLMDVSVAATPQPTSKRRRTTGSTAAAPGARAKGGRASAGAASTTGKTPSASTLARRRRRAAAEAAAAAAAAAAAEAEAEAGADTDVDVDAAGMAGDGDADMDMNGDLDGDLDGDGEAAKAQADEDNDEDELNDMDKTLLGMGDGDSDSE